MMNYIWAIILLVSIAYAFFTGNLSSLSEALTESSGAAVEFVFGLAGIMAMWSGLMEIAERTGLINSLSRFLMPFTKLLFPKQRDPETLSSIIMSFMSNIFGAGNSATVFSLKSMEMLDAENGRSPYASNTMCMFIAVSTTMIQLVPVTVVKVRTDLGSQDPGSIIIPSIVAGLVSMAVTILIAKLFERKSKNVSGL